jgi:hypothetical protein
VADSRPRLAFPRWWRLLGLSSPRGDQHRLDKARWDSDIGRFEQFVGEGWNAIRVTAARMRTPRALVLRVDAALRGGGYDGPAPVFTDEWSQLFQ